MSILKHYEPGDRIFLFGFSRGAYTVRCVAGVLSLCGIPQQVGSDPLPRSGSRLRKIANEAVRSVYEHGAGKDRNKYRGEREEKARRFREKYASNDGDSSNVAPYFIGAFDTVAALGSRGLRRYLIIAAFVSIFLVLPAAALFRLSSLNEAIAYSIGLALIASLLFLKTRLRVIRNFNGGTRWHLSGWRSDFYDMNLDPRVMYVRHAIAIDEKRADFARVGWGRGGHAGPARKPEEPEWFKQVWFAGCHSDIGGGYPEDESRLSDVSLKWMVEEAKAIRHAIRVDDSKLNLFPSALGMQHCEVESLLDRYPHWWPRRWRSGWEQADRKIKTDAPLHSSVIERLSASQVLRCDKREPYRPANLAGHGSVKEYY